MRPWGTAFKTDCLDKIRNHTQIDSDLESKPPENRKTFSSRAVFSLASFFASSRLEKVSLSRLPPGKQTRYYSPLGFVCSQILTALDPALMVMGKALFRVAVTAPPLNQPPAPTLNLRPPLQTPAQTAI